jgi:Holliday junction DNA helicase RuvB
LLRIVERSAKILGITMDESGAGEIARRSRGTPRVANRLLRRARDYAEVRANGHITLGVARDALAMLGVDAHGLDEVDRNLLLTIMQKYSGGPVGLSTLAASLSEEEDAIEEIYEPYLMQLGMLDRTQRGRVVTALAYKHFGMEEPRRQPGLFS